MSQKQENEKTRKRDGGAAETARSLPRGCHCEPEGRGNQRGGSCRRRRGKWGSETRREPCVLLRREPCVALVAHRALSVVAFHHLTCSPTVSLSPSHFLPFASSRFHVFPFSCFNSEIRNPKSALVFLTQVNQQHLTSMVAGEALEQFYASVGVSVAQRNRHDSRS